MSRGGVVGVFVTGLVACGGGGLEQSRQPAVAASGPACTEMATRIVEEIRIDMIQADLLWRPGTAIDHWGRGCIEEEWTVEDRLCMVREATSTPWTACLSPEQRRALALPRVERIRSDMDVDPDYTTKLEMLDSGKKSIDGSFKLCLDQGGAITEVSKFKSTGFSAYDEKLMNAMRRWLYSPFFVMGSPMEACIAVTLIVWPSLTWRQRRG